MTERLTHRRQNNELTTSIMLFAEEGNEHYGENVWTLETELPEVTKEVIDFAAEFYDVDMEEAEDLVNPVDIVDTAGAWDDEQFVSEIWQALECIGFRTNDGAVVLSKEDVSLIYTLEK